MIIGPQKGYILPTGFAGMIRFAEIHTSRTYLHHDTGFPLSRAEILP